MQCQCIFLMLLLSIVSGVPLINKAAWTSKIQEHLQTLEKPNLPAGTDENRVSGARCGVPDIAEMRYGGGLKWSINNLTYSFNNRRSGMSEDVTRKALQTAFAAYSAITPLTFREVEEGGDIHVRFGRKKHECDDDFDGKGGVIAHADFPELGKIHFDSDEQWTVMNEDNLPTTTHTDFLDTAMHEIGHAVGLRHVWDEDSIMKPGYKPPTDRYGHYVEPKLDLDTIETLQQLYGKAPTARATTPTPVKETVPPTERTTERSRKPSSTPSTKPSTKPSNKPSTTPSSNTDCLDDVWAVATLPNSRFIIFADEGQLVTVFNTDIPRKAISSATVSDFFDDGPSRVMAAYFDKQYSYIMLFDSYEELWRYDIEEDVFTLAAGYPKKLPYQYNWKTSTAFNFQDVKVLVGDDGRVAYHFAALDHLHVIGKRRELYSNIPANLMGFADIYGKGNPVGFTPRTVFSYDFETDRYKTLGDIPDFMSC